MTSDMLQPCPNCGKPVSLDRGMCPKCGKGVGSYSLQKSSENEEDWRADWKSQKVALALIACGFSLFSIVSGVYDGLEGVGRLLMPWYLSFVAMYSGAWLLSGLAIAMNYIAGLYFGLVLSWVTLGLAILAMDFLSLVVVVMFLILGHKTLRLWKQIESV